MNDRSPRPHAVTTWMAGAALVVSTVGAGISITTATIARNQAKTAKQQAEIAKQQAQTARTALEINQRALAQKLSVSAASEYSLTITNAGKLPFHSVEIYFQDYEQKPIAAYLLIGDLAGCTRVTINTKPTLPQKLLVVFTDANGIKWQEDAVTSTAASTVISTLLPMDFRDWPVKSSAVSNCA